MARIKKVLVANRGEKVIFDEKGKRTVTTFGKSDELLKVVKKEDWNEYRIVAKGNHLQHFINGKLTVDVTDQQTDKAAASGVLAQGGGRREHRRFGAERQRDAAAAPVGRLSRQIFGERLR